MSGKDLFEKMDLISLEYVEETGEPYQAKKGCGDIMRDLF